MDTNKMDEKQIADGIKQTIENNKIALFMKGEKEFPMCGFSHRAVEILKQYDKPFVAVNILPDPRIRQVLSQYSNWPTIPQVFIDGKFIGGSDILLEMHQENELAPLIKTAFEED